MFSILYLGFPGGSTDKESASLGPPSSEGDARRAPGGLTRGRGPGKGVIPQRERLFASEKETLARAARHGA